MKRLGLVHFTGLVSGYKADHNIHGPGFIDLLLQLVSDRMIWDFSADSRASLRLLVSLTRQFARHALPTPRRCLRPAGL